jgi:hypothetical protein
VVVGAVVSPVVVCVVGAALLEDGAVSSVLGLPGVEAGALVPPPTVVPGGVVTCCGVEEVEGVEAVEAVPVRVGAGAGSCVVRAAVVGVAGAAVRRSATSLRVCGVLDAVIGSGTA